MENKDRLDEFMQRKFAEDDPERRLAFREDYWLQAQALIEAAERRGKRRRALWWWWLTGGAGVLLALGWWWLAGNGSASGQPVVSRSVQAVEQLSSGTANIQPQQPAIEDAHPKAGPETGAPMPAHTPGLDQKNARQQQPQNTGIAPNQPLQGAPEAGADRTARTGHPRHVETGSPGNLRSAISKDAETSPKGYGIAPEAPSQPAAPQPTTSSPKSATLSLPPDGPPGMPSQDTSSRGAGHLAQPQGHIPAALPLRRPLLQAPVPQLKKIEIPQPPVAETPTPLRDWQWELDAHALATTPTGFLSQEKTGLGLGVSLGLQRKGSPFSFHAGTQWRRQQGNAPDSVYVESSKRLQYSFGYLLDETERRIGTMHWLELPIQAQYHWWQFDAVAGVMPALLVALRGKETQTQSSSLKPDPTVVESRSVRLQNRFVARTTTSVVLGAGWRPTPRLRLALQWYYQPGALFKAPVDVDDNRRQHSAWLGVQLGYVFFHTK